MTAERVELLRVDPESIKPFALIEVAGRGGLTGHCWLNDTTLCLGTGSGHLLLYQEELLVHSLHLPGLLARSRPPCRPCQEHGRSLGGGWTWSRAGRRSAVRWGWWASASSPRSAPASSSFGTSPGPRPTGASRGYSWSLGAFFGLYRSQKPAQAPFYLATQAKPRLVEHLAINADETTLTITTQDAIYALPFAQLPQGPTQLSPSSSSYATLLLGRALPIAFSASGFELLRVWPGRVSVWSVAEAAQRLAVHNAASAFVHVFSLRSG